MKYLLSDGGKIEANDNAEFVRKLREGSKFDYDCTDEQYMINFAKRFKISSEIELNTNSFDEFVTDLIKYNYASTS